MTNERRIQPEQFISYYRYLAKWQTIVLSTDPVEPSQVKEAISYAYQIAELPLPEIFFVASPRLQQLKLIDLFKFSSSRPLIRPSILVALWDKLRTPACKAAYDQQNNFPTGIYGETCENQIRYFSQVIRKQLKKEKLYFSEEISGIYSEVDNGIDYRNGEAQECAWLEFAVEVLKANYPLDAVDAFLGLIRHCGLTLQFRNSLIVSDRPRRIDFTVNPPTLEFADGFKA